MQLIFRTFRPKIGSEAPDPCSLQDESGAVPIGTAWHHHLALLFDVTGELCRPYQLRARDDACRQLFGRACRRLDVPDPSSLHDGTRAVSIGTTILHCSLTSLELYVVLISSIPCTASSHKTTSETKANPEYI